MSEITVVIPNYNGMKYLPGCMTSLCERQEDAPEYEVLIIDNASADESVEYLEKEWCRKSGVRVSLIPMSENTGFCHAVNLGIRKAQSPYVILLNNDTKVEQGFLRGLYDAIREDERIFSVSAKMLMWDKPELIDDAGDRYCALGWAYSRGKGRPADKYEKNVSVFSACGGAAIYRRSVFEEIGYFDENHFAYLEDLDIGYRARIYGYENRYEKQIFQEDITHGKKRRIPGRNAGQHEQSDEAGSENAEADGREPESTGGERVHCDSRRRSRRSNHFR